MILNVLLVMTATVTALMAGLFYAWSCSVMPGFAKLPNREFVSAMQSTNRAIQNPVFFIAFLGAPVLLPLSAFLHYGQPGRFWFLFAAVIVYLPGTFGLTIFGNIPLNNTLERFDPESATEEETALQRANFEKPWNKLNTIRTVSSTAALIFVVIACLHF